MPKPNPEVAEKLQEIKEVIGDYIDSKKKVHYGWESSYALRQRTGLAEQQVQSVIDGDANYTIDLLLRVMLAYEVTFEDIREMEEAFRNN